MGKRIALEGYSRTSNRQPHYRDEKALFIREKTRSKSRIRRTLLRGNESKGFAKKVIGEERVRTWNLPYFGVTNPNKPNRVRLVLVAAAKTYGISLNDQLEPRPDILHITPRLPLPGVLTLFREYEVASEANIKDMYLSVGMREADRGALRFLWRDQDRQKCP